MARKVDRRILRTRRLLSEALLALIIEQDYDKITIQDIADQADVNRATFYLHYGTKDELLVASLSARFDELVKRMEAATIDSPPWEDYTQDLFVFEHVAEYAPLYKVLLSERGTGYIMHRIIDYISFSALRDIQRFVDDDFEFSIPVEIICRHISGSLFAILSWWVLNDMPYSVDYVAQKTHEIVSHGCYSVFVPPPESSENATPQN